MRTHARPLYPRAALYFGLLLATAVLGFSGTYFSRLADNNLIRHVHAAIAFAWILLLISQAWWIRRRDYSLHRQLGRTSLVLVPLFVISGLLLTQDMLARPGPFIAPYAQRLAFIDLTSIAWFAIAFALALHHRRQTPLHARYMASTALLVLPPALTRALGATMPAISSFDQALHTAYFITEALLLALIAHDLRSEGRVRAPYPLLLGLMLLHQAAFLLLPKLPAWARFCAWLAGR